MKKKMQRHMLVLICFFVFGGAFLVTAAATAAPPGAPAEECVVAPLSDTFDSGSLDTTVWTFVNPLDDASLSVNPDTVGLSVPAGTMHTIWTSDYTVARLMQDTEDRDFDVEVAFDSLPVGTYAQQGIVVEGTQGSDPYLLRLEFFSSDSTLYLYAASLRSGSATTRVYTSIPSNPTMWMRIVRTGDTWTLRYSLDGLSWTDAATFSERVVVSKIGVYAGNSGQNPAHTATINSFINHRCTESDPTTTPTATAAPTTTPTTTAAPTTTPTTTAAPTTTPTAIAAPTTTPTATATLPEDPGEECVVAPLSDTFDSGSLDTTVWTFVNPLDDASLTVNPDTVGLSVPAGTMHTIWGSDYTVARLMQDTEDRDFDVEVAFDSLPVGNYAHQGIVVEGTQGNDPYLLRLEFFSSGSTLYLYAAGFRNGNHTTYVYNGIPSNPTMWIRIVRTGETWMLRYSLDGASWNDGVTFSERVAVSKIGVYAGNSGQNPAHTATINSFINHRCTEPDPTPTPTPTATATPANPATPTPTTTEIPIETTTATPIATVTETPPDPATPTPTPEEPGEECVVAPLSDTFSSDSLDTTVWTFVNPLDDASLTVNPDTVELSVPAGTMHTIWGNDYTVARLMQDTEDRDFDVEVAFDSLPEGNYAHQGIVVEGTQDSAPYLLRLEFFSNNGTLYAYAAGFRNGNHTTYVYTGIPSNPTMWIRIVRTGNTWTLRYSLDGLSWNDVVTFTDEMTMSKIGVYAGNSGQNPPYTATINSFINHRCTEPDPTPTPTPTPTATPANPATPTATQVPTPTPTTDPLPVMSDLTYTYDHNQETLLVEWTTNSATIGQVEYGVTPGDGDTQVGSGYTQNHSISVSNLQAATTYHFQVTATESDGDSTTSPDITFSTYATTAEDEIDIWYGINQKFGMPGQSQRWANILGRVSGDVTSLRYSLNDGAAQPLTIGPEPWRLEDEGDFNIDIDFANLIEGLNTVTIIAADASGQEYIETVIVEYASGHVWPLAYTIDWSSVDSIQDGAKVVDGLWTLDKASGTIHTAEPGYDRMIVIGDMYWDDYEIEVPVTIHEINPRTDGGYATVGLVQRWQGHYDWFGDQPHQGWWPFGALAFYGAWPGNTNTQLALEGNSAHKLLTYPYDSSRAVDSDFWLEEGNTYIFKLQVQSGTDIVYSFKVWPENEPEPAEWSLRGYALHDGLDEGSMALLAYHSDVSFGNVTIRPLPAGPQSLESGDKAPSIDPSLLMVEDDDAWPAEALRPQHPDLKTSDTRLYLPLVRR